MANCVVLPRINLIAEESTLENVMLPHGDLLADKDLIKVVEDPAQTDGSDEETIVPPSEQSARKPPETLAGNCEASCERNSIEDTLPNEFELETEIVTTFKRDFSNKKEISSDVNGVRHFNYTQFKEIWFDIMKWKNIFQECDTNKSRTVNLEELRAVFDYLGVN